MRIRRMRIGGAHNLTQQNERWICELVFFQDRIERNIFAVMPKLAIGHVEYDSVCDRFPVSIAPQEDKLRVSVDKFFDQPWAGNSVHFNFLASDPFHELDSSFVAACFLYAVIAAILYGAHQIFTRLAAERIGEGLGGFVVEASAALRSEEHTSELQSRFDLVCRL